MAKFIFDRVVAFFFLLVLGPVILVLVLVSSIDTQSFGIFTQKRVGQHGKLFHILKIKTIHPKTGHISTWNRYLRKSKLDELPQLFNILIGQMSFVGPRPDIPGYYDKLNPDQQVLLSLRPGLTSQASIKYKDEEILLQKQSNPLEYNDSVIFPDKVKINMEYYYKRTFLLDLKILCFTLFYRSK